MPAVLKVGRRAVLKVGRYWVKLGKQFTNLTPTIGVFLNIGKQ